MEPTGRRSEEELIACVVSELVGLNLEYESAEDVAARIVDLVRNHAVHMSCLS